MEAPGEVSLRFPYANYTVINSIEKDIDLEAPGDISFRILLDILINTNRTSIGNKPGSSRSQFLYISSCKLRKLIANSLGSSWDEFFWISLFNLKENQWEIGLEAPGIMSFRFPSKN